MNLKNVLNVPLKKKEEGIAKIAVEDIMLQKVLIMNLLNVENVMRDV